jgi:hypothetical protein
MEKHKILEKCWLATYKPEPHYSDLVYGETLGKAKYQLYNSNCDGESFIEFMKNYSFTREPGQDLLEPMPMEIISTLNKKQLQAICHSNGNDSSKPGHRNYFNTSSDTHEVMVSLVNLGLMEGPFSHVGGGSFNWFLTGLGSLAAMSVLPIKACDVKSTLNERKEVLDWLSKDSIPTESGTTFKMEMFKVNRALIKLAEKVTVRIRSGQWGMYWRPDGCGYTNDGLEAGLYDFKDAFERTSHCGPEKQIYFQVV